jgi:hypothetical protein
MPLRWTLIAPSEPQAAFGLSFVYEDLPLDANSGLPVEIDRNTGFKTVPLSVRQKRIMVNLIDDIVESDSVTNTATYNQDALGALFAFEVSNNDYTEELRVDSIAFSILEPGSNNRLSATFVRNMIERFLIVDKGYYLENKEALLKSTKNLIDEPYVDFLLGEASGVSPVGLMFDIDAVIPPDTSETFIVLADFLPKADLRSFNTRLNHIHAFDVNRNIPLPIIDEEGTLIAQSQMFNTKATISVISADEDAVFGNFPNPFGGSRGDLTRFQFQINNSADVVLRIYSLVGELVKSYESVRYGPGVHRNIIWDGKNDNGNVVINGVYIAIIDVKPVNGSGKVYKTKVAFIK